MLLTQSQLQTKWEELHWWMSGDKYDVNGAFSFSAAPYCLVPGSKFGFGYDSAAHAAAQCGALVLPFAVI
ncbi:hypothetical protein A2482_01820 [Candidatus Falkowbacteria bacterium RIFOXYC2_FULL_48_21]|uniref:Uncharacterized protein n=1 Tax=Candidatus Falkowbacteria bacterium RIFOXYC2_FULL_48_21 TaxID=1798005 RepID=A0A1F5TFS2_9BACT|nr:MAG: hypothetical protein A2482_01820 [Candidatus Falkowbacteria bacterium RIFOXYC2_FULL_48_21]